MSAAFEIPCRASAMVDFRGGMPKTKKQCCIRVSYLCPSWWLLWNFCIRSSSTCCFGFSFMQWDVHFLHLIDHDPAHCLLWKVCMGYKSLNFFATANSYGCGLPCMIPQESTWISSGCGVACLRSMLWIQVLKDLLLHLIAHSSAFFAGYLIKVDNLSKHFKVEKEKKCMSGSSASKYWLFFETMEELIQIQI